MFSAPLAVLGFGTRLYLVMCEKLGWLVRKRRQGITFHQIELGKVLGCLFVIQQKPDKNNLGNNMARRIMEIMKCI